MTEETVVCYIETMFLQLKLGTMGCIYATYYSLSSGKHSTNFGNYHANGSYNIERKMLIGRPPVYLNFMSQNVIGMVFSLQSQPVVYLNSSYR